MNHFYTVMPMLTRDWSKGAHQLLQLKYCMLNILSSPKRMYSFLYPPCYRFILVLLEARNQVAVEVICCLFNFNERSPVS